MLQSEYLDELRRETIDAYENGREAFVVEAFTNYFTYRPEDAYAWFVYGDSLRVLGRKSEAEEALKNALQHAPEDHRVGILGNIGTLHSDWGRHSEAERFFQEAVQTEDGSELGWLWIMRGANLARMGEFERAIECHRHATQCEGDQDEAFLNLGLVLRALARYSDARAAFTRALQLTPDYAKASESLDSLEDIEKGIELGRGIPDYND